jgi:L-threonylcarbamoyladenylate synthase
LTVDPPEVLRPGGLPFEVLRGFLGRVMLNPVVVADRVLSVVKARSPGVVHKHYAPSASVVVVEGEVGAVVDKVRELVGFYVRDNKRVGVLATDETVHEYGAGVVKSVGSRADLAGVARSLFRILREFDLEGVDVIVAEGVPLEGFGLAVMNRLRRASGFNIIRV